MKSTEQYLLPYSMLHGCDSLQVGPLTIAKPIRLIASQREQGEIQKQSFFLSKGGKSRPLMSSLESWPHQVSENVHLNIENLPIPNGFVCAVRCIPLKQLEIYILI